MNNFPDPVSSFLVAYASAALAKDVDAFCALYAEDVCVFDAWDRWSYKGIDAWREMISGWFSSLGSERVLVESHGVASWIAGGLALGHAVLTYIPVSADGRRLPTIENRMTVALRDIDGKWKVVHEHTSCPVDFRSKAVLLRTPQ